MPSPCPLMSTESSQTVWSRCGLLPRRVAYVSPCVAPLLDLELPLLVLQRSQPLPARVCPACFLILPPLVALCATPRLQVLEGLKAGAASGSGRPFPKLLYTVPTGQNPTGELFRSYDTL
jgi:hypothetical protein